MFRGVGLSGVVREDSSVYHAAGAIFSILKGDKNGRSKTSISGACFVDVVGQRVGRAGAKDWAREVKAKDAARRSETEMCDGRKVGAELEEGVQVVVHCRR
jgi:hypothetical protein